MNQVKEKRMKLGKLGAKNKVCTLFCNNKDNNELFSS